MSRKKLLRRAAAAVRQARAEGVDIPRQLTKRSKKKRTIVDDNVLEELKNARKKLKKSRKEAIRDTPYHDDFKNTGFRAKFSWDFQPGQLVTIKQNPGKHALHMMKWRGVNPGDSGLVIESVGDDIKVMGPHGMQSWRCSWVWDITEDE